MRITATLATADDNTWNEQTKVTLELVYELLSFVLQSHLWKDVVVVVAAAASATIAFVASWRVNS